MRIDIVNGSVVTGDGKSLLENTSVITQNTLIADVPAVPYVPYNAPADRVINANGGYIIPGIINIHAHGVTFGPFFPYAWTKMPRKRVLSNLNNHLLQGTTTILSTDGFTLPSEADAVNKIHPVNVKRCTGHTPLSFKAAEVIAGEGLTQWHRRYTAEEAVSAGAVALGEVGSPGTAYGTAEKARKLGRFLPAPHALALDQAVINGTEADIRTALTEAGLTKMTITEARKLVEETSIIPVAPCCDAIKESVEYVRKLEVPVLVHAEPGMKEAILDVAREIGPKLIALHVNHGFTMDESLKLAHDLKNAGGLLVLQKAIEEGALTLPQAIYLATSAAAKLVPGVAPDRGLIQPGKVADLCVVERDDISQVRCVIIAGEIVVEGGRIVSRVE
jgi:imidazolonepropionase-like amidohydrolase